MSKDLIKDIILILLGGGVASTIIVTAFQTLINKIIENSANMIIEKKMESFRTKLNRAMSAYELLLDKEMKFYEQFDSHKALFVPLIQDMVYYLELSVKNPDVPQTVRIIEPKS